MELQRSPARDERGRFVVSRQKRSEAADLRTWKRDRSARDRLAGCVTGSHLLAAVGAGRAYPHPGVARSAVALRVACTVRATGQTLSDGELAVLGWLAGADLGLARGGGVCLSLAEIAQLARCSVRTAGTRVRRLVALGVVLRTPHYQELPEGCRSEAQPWRRHLRGPNFYGIAPWVVREIAAGKDCQAEDKITPYSPSERERRPCGPRGRTRGSAAPAAEIVNRPTDGDRGTGPAPAVVGPEAPEGAARGLAWRRVAAAVSRDLRARDRELVELRGEVERTRATALRASLATLAALDRARAVVVWNWFRINIPQEYYFSDRSIWHFWNRIFVIMQ